MTEEHAIVEDYVLGTSFKILKISGARISTIYETRIRYANQYHCVDIYCSLALLVCYFIQSFDLFYTGSRSKRKVKFGNKVRHKHFEKITQIKSRVRNKFVTNCITKWKYYVSTNSPNMWWRKYSQCSCEWNRKWNSIIFIRIKYQFNSIVSLQQEFSHFQSESFLIQMKTSNDNLLSLMNKLDRPSLQVFLK